MINSAELVNHSDLVTLKTKKFYPIQKMLKLLNEVFSLKNTLRFFAPSIGTASRGSVALNALDSLILG